MFKMWILRKVCMILFLFICSVQDLRTRRIPLLQLLLFLLFAIVGRGMFEKEAVFSNVNLWIGLFCGLFFLAISWLGHEKLGFADSIVILTIFLMEEYQVGMSIVIISFMIAGIIVVYCLISGRMTRQTTIPFLPFLFSGYIIGSVIEGVMK